MSIVQLVTSHALGFGLYAQNIFGFNEVKQSAFLHTKESPNFMYKDSGNAKFSFEEISESETSLVINSSLFKYGGRLGYHKVAGGLNVYINHTGVNVSIINITAHGNSGQNSGNVALFLATHGSWILVNHSNITGGRAIKGGGLRFWYKQDQYTKESTCPRRLRRNVLAISNTRFEDNSVKQTGGAMYVAYYNNSTLDNYDCIRRNIIIRDCTFIRNGGNGAAMEIILHSLTDHRLMPLFRTSIEKCTFEGNFLPPAWCRWSSHRPDFS